MNKKVNLKVNWINRKSIPMYILFIYFLFVGFIYSKQDATQTFREDSMLFLFVLGALLSFIYMVELTGVKNFFKAHSKWINGLVLILSPVLSFVLVEVMMSNYNLDMFMSYSFYNIIWYVVIYFLFYAMIRNIKTTIILSNLFVYIAALANYLVLIFKGNPLLPSDLLAWKTGMSVASHYELSFTKGFVIATYLMLILFVLANKLENTRLHLTMRNRIGGLSIYVLFVIAVFTMFFRTNLIDSKISVLDFFAPKYTYCFYGTAFGFVANVEALETEVPDGYSIEKVESEFEGIDKEAGELSSDPNIIVIMNEAYSDLSLIGNYETNIEYRPYTQTLTENTIKGSLYVSVYGGATSNTEYEFLTGNSMAVMPINSVPYQQFITEPTDSLASTLKSQGYYNIAIHPYKRSGYKRDIVYPLLGFDEFLSMEDFEDPELIRSFISDRESFHKIMEQFETKATDKPLFVFNVTMQNHGGYSEDKFFEEDNNVKLTEMSGYSNVEQYLSLVRNSDQAFQLLIDYFTKQEEPTIILMYGDHQPAIFSNLPDNSQKGEKEEDKLGIDQSKYIVPFIIWANYDIKESYIDKMSANYLSSYLLEVAGVQGTEYNQYLMNLYKELPVINDYFYIDHNNKSYLIDDEESKYSEYITSYRYVGYNNALDKKTRLDKLYSVVQ